MSATLIAVVLALFIGHVMPSLTQLRRFRWFQCWLAFGQRYAPALFSSPFSIVLGLGLPLVLVGLIQCGLEQRFFGLPGFVFSVATLVYCWGPRDLDQDVDAVAEATDDAGRAAAIARLGSGQLPTGGSDAEHVVSAVFSSARQRWFGVLLWFLLLGPFGAFLYRLCERGANSVTAATLPAGAADSYRRVLMLLDWPAAHLMTLALAVIGNFDTVYRHWRDWHAARRGLAFDFSADFLDVAGRASVRHFLREVAELPDGTGIPMTTTGLETDSTVALRAAMSLVWRCLIAWLVVVALLVLAGYV